MIAVGRICRRAAAETGVLPASPSSARLAKIAVGAAQAPSTVPVAGERDGSAGCCRDCPHEVRSRPRLAAHPRGRWCDGRLRLRLFSKADNSRLVGRKGRPACFARVRVLRLVEPTAFRADTVRPAGRVTAILMLGGWR